MPEQKESISRILRWVFMLGSVGVLVGVTHFLSRAYGHSPLWWKRLLVDGGVLVVLALLSFGCMLRILFGNSVTGNKRRDKYLFLAFSMSVLLGPQNLLQQLGYDLGGKSVTLLLCGLFFCFIWFALPRSR